MDLIQRIELSNSTLLFFSIYPFLFFAYRNAYWYRPDVIKRFDILYTIFAILLACAIGLKLLQGPGTKDWEMMQLGLLHFSPLLLAVLIASGAVRGQRMGRAASTDGKTKEAAYLPAPINQDVENLTWNDLVIDQNLRDEFLSVITLLRDPKTAKQYGISLPKGILLYGPPGTGKTTIAKVIARTAGCSFFLLKVDEVISKWVGESEKNLSALFQAAKRHAPSIIFIDELDSVGKQRGGSQAWADNLLNHLLTLVDGVIKQEGLYIIGATNRPEMVDLALVRAGRLEKMIEIPLPDFEQRFQLFQLGFSKLRFEDAVDLQALARITEGKSGADIKAICNQAGVNAFKRESGQKRREYTITIDDVKSALQQFL